MPPLGPCYGTPNTNCSPSHQVVREQHTPTDGGGGPDPQIDRWPVYGEARGAAPQCRSCLLDGPAAVSGAWARWPPLAVHCRPMQEGVAHQPLAVRFFAMQGEAAHASPAHNRITWPHPWLALGQDGVVHGLAKQILLSLWGLFPRPDL